MRSDIIKKGYDRAPHRALLKATGVKTVKGKGVRSEEWLDMVPEAEYSMGI